MKGWKWLIIIIAVIVVGLAILIADARRGEIYASLDEVREDIAFYHAEIMGEVTFDDHIMFFVVEERERPYFYGRVLKETKDGEFQQIFHSAMISEGMTLEQEWKELWNKTYRLRFGAHEEGAEPFGFSEDDWKYAHEGEGAGWHFSYEILKKDGFGDFAPVEIQ
ncbi:MAG: hypothetical protein J6A71_03760 [Anaerotignum sp.]|nr:hypothetical protein [Anaerotignum sp.]